MTVGIILIIAFICMGLFGEASDDPIGSMRDQHEFDNERMED